MKLIKEKTKISSKIKNNLQNEFYWLKRGFIEYLVL
jgi:hypothetical protein